MQIKKNPKAIIKPKRKVDKLHLWATIVSCFVALALVCVIIAIVVFAILLKDKPEINADDFDQTESSIVYDSKGEEIANLGNVIRVNVEFEEVPNCLVDAFVAIEDSRFFEHNGFDIPRFTKAFIENIMTMSFGQGGSTFTMQLVKNTYFTNDETGQEASRSGMSGIKRKVQEIALAMKLESLKSKQDIFESYLNILNFGGDNNIRGVKKAAQYYFSKDVNELNISEAALLAGVINAPNAYNPFNNLYKNSYSYLNPETDYLQLATERRNEVLYQMYNHGYITELEYNLAKSIKVEDQLTEPYSSSGDYEGIPYQAYIDAVVSEVNKLTGLDPYSTTMHIYTYMNKDIQAEMDKIQAGEFEEDYLYYPDKYMEVASVCINNKTGQVVGILGGRNYANGGQLLLNHATEQYKQPGSTMKPILDYALAFEELGWATDHVITDEPIWLNEEAGIPVYNDSGTYVGDVTLKQAVGNSINTCAIKTLKEVVKEKNYDYVVNYAQSLGYDFTLDDFNIQYAIGGSSCEVTPYQHAAAYAAIMNYGLYNTPHTVARIEFTNGKSPITPTYQAKQIISDASAFLTTELMYSNVNSFGGTYSYVKSSEYPVYGKTGTTDYGKEAKDFGIPSGSIKDGWLVAATSEYTTATWIGYEKIVSNQQSYIPKDFYYNERPNGKIAHLILDACYKYGDKKPTKLEQPSGIRSITHIIGTWPYEAPIEGMDPAYITTGLIKTDKYKIVSSTTPTLEQISSGQCSVEGANTAQAILNISWSKMNKQINLEQNEEGKWIKDISLVKNGQVVIGAKGICLYHPSLLFGSLVYKADITVTYANGETKTFPVISKNDHASQMIGNVSEGATIKYSLYYGYANGGGKTKSIDDKIVVDAAKKISVKFPKANSTYEQIEQWASDKSYITLVKEPSDAEKPFTIVDQNGTSYTPGETYEINPTSTITITYYDKDTRPSIAITSDSNAISKGLTVTITTHTKNIDETIQWSASTGSFVSTSDSQAILQIPEDCLETSVTVTASANGVSDQCTIIIN